MSHFTPYSALAGGLLIGLASALFLFLNGRRAGISGIVGGLLSPECPDPVWRLCFLAGLLLGPLWISKTDWLPVNIEVNGSLPLMALAGLLVGYGTSLGSGCTSGHGICGLARFSLRSLAATLTFMLSAGMTVYIVRHLLGAGE
ncbi:YeeE/YedE family protein [Candidatus Methylomicrobium oryzae]|uniref:YeeE/YedE family protein n=1 Tax=Candidatus Methylomicrobium oryzae TaxID=2802053 RepID=UPI0019222E60|nr:YeeE/YedE family protein [Methylomicrobium sp. RS1]MBL1265834.1 YeeE/YedE family protein [Methylomicrobium sp. RS1]